MLGVTWDTQADTLLLRSTTTKFSGIPSKRTVLKFIASYFDPLGLVSPTLLLAKIFLNKLWTAKYSWDEQLHTNLDTKWNIIIKSIEAIASSTFPRFIGLSTKDENVSYELHCFCDASATAYGACVYLRIITATSTTSNLVFAKSRLAPLKSVSLPRLELTAVHIGNRILHFIARSLKFRIARQFIWSDSQCVLHWLVSKKPQTLFTESCKRNQPIQQRYSPLCANQKESSQLGITWQNSYRSIRIITLVVWPTMANQ